MKKSRGNKGQFSIIAALLVSIILVAAVIMTYSMISHNPSRESPKVLTSIGEVNVAIKRILEFTVGYYGSILQVTGNTTYAKDLAASYFQSGLVYIAHSHPEWNPSFEVDFQQVSTRWFTPVSYSMGNISVTYSLSGLGIEGVKYETSSILKATVLEPANYDQARILVTREGNEPELRLRRENFFFYNYSYSDSTWNFVHPDSDPITLYDGTYVLQIPSGVNQDSYSIKVVDPRGITLIAFYSENSLATGIPQYSYTFTWNSSLYSSLTRDTLVVEALQNGTLRWLGQNLQLLETAGPYVLYGKPSLGNGWDSNPGNIYDLDTSTYGTYNAKTGSAYVSAFNTSTGTINRVDVRIRWEWSGDPGSDTVEWVWNIGGSGGGRLYEPCDMSHSLATDSYNAIGSNWTWSGIQNLRIQLNYVKDGSAGPNVKVHEIWILLHVEVAGSYVVSKGKPIPPIPVKDLRVNQTIDGVNREVPFQVEDWGSNYRVPLGLTSNASVFSSRNMLAFLVNHRVQKVTLWWDGRDTANQTSYAWTNRYFTGDDVGAGRLTNGILTMTIDDSGSNFIITSSIGTSTSTAKFMRINNEEPIYGSNTAYVIHHGIVRDIVQQEAEWSGGVLNCPNVYSQIVLTLPANATYYTYALRLIFVNSSQSRTITDLSAIQLSSGWMSGTLRSLTENGTSSGYPIVAETYMGTTNLFYNFSSPSTGWAHHWSEYISGSTGAGMMFTDNSNRKLYTFDSIASQKTGALDVTTAQRTDWKTPTAVYDRCGQDPSYPVSRAIDGSTSTSWRHSTTENHWIILDMGQTMDISRIRIYQSGTSSYRWGQSSGIEVYVSNNTSSWRSVWNGTLDSSGWQSSGTFSVQGRYVKLYSRSTSSSQRFYEVGVEVQERQATIEFNPVERYSASFTTPLDVTWHGAVATFVNEPIYPTSGNIGLWVIVEHPPIVAVS